MPVRIALLTALEVLRSATVNGARTLGLAGQVGGVVFEPEALMESLR